MNCPQHSFIVEKCFPWIDKEFSSLQYSYIKREVFSTRWYSIYNMVDSKEICSKESVFTKEKFLKVRFMNICLRKRFTKGICERAIYERHSWKRVLKRDVLVRWFYDLKKWLKWLPQSCMYVHRCVIKYSRSHTQAPACLLIESWTHRSICKYYLQRRKNNANIKIETTKTKSSS